MTDKMRLMLDKTEQILNANSMFAEIYDITETVIKVEITWGDWKHDHLRLDYLMNEAGFKIIDSYVTEEDGSDTYSGVHVYSLV